MRYFFPIVPSLLAILFGGILLLPLLAWSTLQDPCLEDAGYYHAVVVKLLGPRVIGSVLLGVGLIVLGHVGVLYTLFLAGADKRERRESLPVFWGAVVVGTVATLSVLVAVNCVG
jgi:hypothetical protein